MRMIIVGCGRVGSGLARALDKRGHAVTVIDMNTAAFEKLGKGFKGQCIEGVGFDREALLQAGIERADGVAGVTSSDETNVVVANAARRFFQVPNVAARVYDPRLAEIFNRLGLRTITPTTWGVNRLVDLLCHAEMNTVLSLGNGELDIVREDVPPMLVGRTVHELTLQSEIAVIAMVRNGKAFLPTLGTVLQAGDVVYLSALATSMDRLHKLLQPA